MRSPEVDAWFEAYENPMKGVLLYMRELILGSDERIEESIKWKSPTFSYKGNIASFNPRSRRHASLIFHTGASIPGDFRTWKGRAKSPATSKRATWRKPRSLGRS